MAERALRRSLDVAVQQGGRLRRATRAVRDHWKLAASGAVTAGLLTMPPSQFVNKIDVVGAAVGLDTISCVDGVQPAHQGYAADELVLLGTGNRRDRIERTYAAVDDLIAGTAPVLFVDDGPNDGLRSQLKLIRQIYKHKTGRKLPKNELISVGTAVDTANNIQLLTQTMTRRGDRVAAIVTNAGRENRAEAVACQDGVASFPLPAEQTLAVYDRGVLRRMGKDSFTIFSFVKERGELLSTVVDPGDGLTTDLHIVFQSPKMFFTLALP